MKSGSRFMSHRMDFKWVITSIEVNNHHHDRPCRTLHTWWRISSEHFFNNWQNEPTKRPALLGAHLWGWWSMDLSWCYPYSNMYLAHPLCRHHRIDISDKHSLTLIWWGRRWMVQPSLNPMARLLLVSFFGSVRNIKVFVSIVVFRI